MNAASCFFTNKVFAILLLSLVTLVSSSSASYYEDWIVEAEVLEVLEEKELAEVLRQNPHLQRDAMFIGLKIKVTKCDLKDGHASRMCNPGRLFAIALNYKGERVAEKVRKGAVLRMRYFYSNGMGPEGLVESHRWEAVE